MSESVRPFSLSDLPVLTGTEAAAFDAAAIQGLGVPEAALMERAGTAAARIIQELAPAGSVTVLAGKGNNGGDAVVVARCLTAWGRDVSLLSTDDGDAHDALLHGWPISRRYTPEMSDEALGAALSPDTVVVDGVLGTGIRGAPRGEAARLVDAVEVARTRLKTVVSLDIPSGVDADTGEDEGALTADVTVAFGWPKLGTVLHPGRARAGRLIAVEIGFPPLPHDHPSARLLTPAWAAAHRPVRELVTHKNRVGAVAVVAGRPGMAGAALLAGRSALRAGAGYVRIVTHPDNREIVQSSLPEAVFVDATDGEAVAEGLSESRAVVVGPGMGTDAAAARLLATCLEADRPLVVDADALTLLSSDPGLRDRIPGRHAVLTPHLGEARRLVPELPESPLQAAEAVSDVTGGVVLLKGTPSLVFGPQGIWLDSVGSSDLAAAGMGDTLAGAIGAFLGQGVQPDIAAGLGLVTTGRAAARVGKGSGLQTADVPEALPSVLVEDSGETDLALAGVLLDMDPPR